MVLTLKAASSKGDLAAATQAGAVLIFSDEMFQLGSHDYQAHTKSGESDGKQQQGFESEPFIQSAQHLLEQIKLSATGLGWKANGMRHLALVACHATALCTLPPAVPAQSLLQRLFAHIHTLIRNIIATCFLVKTFVGAVMHQGNILAAKEQQAHRIGEWLLGIQTAVQRQMQRGSSVFLVNAALTTVASVLKSSREAQKSAKHKSSPHWLKPFQVSPSLSPLEEYTLARYAPTGLSLPLQVPSSADMLMKDSMCHYSLWHALSVLLLITGHCFPLTLTYTIRHPSL